MDWLGAAAAKGSNNCTPVIQLGGRPESVSRLVMRLLGRLEDETLLVCHTCDRRICVNPSHLFIGTQKDNVADKLAQWRGNNPRE